MSFIHVMQHECFNKRATKATVWLVSLLTATSLPPHHFLSVKNKQKAGISVFSCFRVLVIYTCMITVTAIMRDGWESGVLLPPDYFCFSVPMMLTEIHFANNVIMKQSREMFIPGIPSATFQNYRWFVVPSKWDVYLYHVLLCCYNMLSLKCENGIYLRGQSHLLTTWT